ncbi:Rhodanese-related sulfurtransferase (plasmid) [Mycolicibacterium gilvum Spyr1]|uniref:Rhodanese-related sulfurtransferase n=1 Tax=Mycolicibacterium gilvum (strain DSM 45189 / LMG 24558 / Spyr1) TaxID=278137 RepID=E6TQ77_MYCSR|nr:Rhodanese-related sulfurtransferase [Mycolicibacterium gilvum Spyr1]MCV7155468.1 rhodanese-like domain-containing protein [Mycolicibacterium pyrenivorans]
MPNAPVNVQRQSRSRQHAPSSVPQPLEHEADLVAVDTTWGELQPLQCAPGVVTVAELELIESLRSGALLLDTRLPDSRSGVTIPGAVSIPHNEIAHRSSELDASRVNVLFCNGPQCPQSPDAIRELLKNGFPASALAYYRGGLHDWITLAMPTEPVA